MCKIARKIFANCMFGLGIGGIVGMGFKLDSGIISFQNFTFYTIIFASLAFLFRPRAIKEDFE